MSEKKFNPPRVLLSAYQCAPRTEAISHIGWEWYSRLARRIPTTLVTHIRNREDLLRAGAPLAHSEVIFIDTEWFAKPLYELACKLFPTSEHARSLLCSPDFYVYDWMAVKQLKARMNAGAQWDIIHAVTPVSPMAATRLHLLKRPLVLGPWNGGLKTDKNFREIMKKDSGWLYPIRHLGYLIDFIIGSSRHASVILTATQATWQSIPAHYHPHCRFILENGVDLELFTYAPWPASPSNTQPLHIVFVGRFQWFKGLPMLLEAIAHLKDRLPVRLTVVGDGPLKEQWQNQAENLDINHLITWYGTATPKQVVAQMQAAHVLCLPSVRESGGAVLLEAMACARPVLTIKYGGPAEVVDESVGYAIPPEGGTATVIAALVDSLHDIALRPEVWRRRGEMGRQRAERFYGWEAKIDQVLALYQELLQTR